MAERHSSHEGKMVDTDEMHDIVIHPKNNRPQRFPITRETSQYPTGEPFGRERPGGRKARAIADFTDAFGPALAIAPTRPEPAAQNGTCIIVNQDNVRIKNTYTAARLNNEPDIDNSTAGPAEPDIYRQRLHEKEVSGDFELLVAAPDGKVYFIAKQGSTWTHEEVTNLGLEGDIWYQLRNGLVAGSAKCHAKRDKALPLVNVAALKRED